MPVGKARLDFRHLKWGWVGPKQRETGVCTVSHSHSLSPSVSHSVRVCVCECVKHLPSQVAGQLQWVIVPCILLSFNIYKPSALPLPPSPSQCLSASIILPTLHCTSVAAPFSSSSLLPCTVCCVCAHLQVHFQVLQMTSLGLFDLLPPSILTCDRESWNVSFFKSLHLHVL